MFHRVGSKVAKQILRNTELTFISMHINAFGFFPPFNSMVYFKQTVGNFVNAKEGDITIPELLRVTVKIIDYCGKNYF